MLVKEEKDEPEEQADEHDEPADDGAGDEPTGHSKLQCNRKFQGEEDEEVIFRADCKLWKLVILP